MAIASQQGFRASFARFFSSQTQIQEALGKGKVECLGFATIREPAQGLILA